MRQRKSSFHGVVASVKAERQRQADKWGSEHDSQHTLGDWLDILRHELEEARTAPSDSQCLTELRHVAAVAFAALEWCGATEEGEG